MERIGRGEPLASEAARGAAAGLVATLGMSVVMLAARRTGLMGTQPPERIVERASAEVDARPGKPAQDVAASVAHLAFGAACGVAYALIARRLPSGIASLAAVPYALGIWLVSYAGWIPALRILPPPSRDEPGRVAAMIAAHVVYGAILGPAWNLLRGPGQLQQGDECAGGWRGRWSGRNAPDT